MPTPIADTFHLDRKPKKKPTAGAKSQPHIAQAIDYLDHGINYEETIEGVEYWLNIRHRLLQLAGVR